MRLSLYLFFPIKPTIEEIKNTIWINLESLVRNCFNHKYSRKKEFYWYFRWLQNGLFSFCNWCVYCKIRSTRKLIDIDTVRRLIFIYIRCRWFNRRSLIDTSTPNLAICLSGEAQRRRFNGTVERRFMPSVLCPVSRIITRNSLLLQSMMSETLSSRFYDATNIKIPNKICQRFFPKDIFSHKRVYMYIFLFYLFFFWLDSLNYEKNM